jgi:cell cycle checkpoint protein
MSSASSQEDTSASLSQKSSAASKRRAQPPARLEWPAGGMTHSQWQSQSQQPTTNETKSSRKTKVASKIKSSKRQRTLQYTNDNKDKDSHDDSHDSSQLLWTEKYAPACTRDLCVAPKKVAEVASWLSSDGNERLLILVGRPGIGKSAMIRVLAEEANLEVLEWTETFSTWSPHVDSQTPLNSFAQFLQQGGYSSLGCQVTTTTTSTKSQLVLPQQRLILLEDLPHLANAESLQRFRELFTNHVQGSHTKTVWIYSNVTEGKNKPQDLERHIEPQVLYAHAKILQVNPATKPQLKKALERIAKAQGFHVTKDFCERMHLQSQGDVRYAIMALQFDQAGRRHNNNNNSNNKSFFAPKNKKAKSQQPTQAPLEVTRDTQWTAFHALGKILYAKRDPVDDQSYHKTPGERPPLQFDPEAVLEHCDMDLGNVLTYLEFHSPDFFTDIEELSTAFDLYSDASHLLEQTTNYNFQRKSFNNSNNTVRSPIFPEGYVASLAGRSVAYANHHPAPSRFRQLQAPKILEIRRKRTDNEYQLHIVHGRCRPWHCQWRRDTFCSGSFAFFEGH